MDALAHLGNSPLYRAHRRGGGGFRRTNEASMETAMAKLYASEAAMWTTTKAVQIHGGMDIPSIFPERYMRDPKITEIYEGANEVQRIVIAGATLKQAGAE